MSDRKLTEERKAKNEVLFKKINEKVRRAEEDMLSKKERKSRLIDFVCECENMACIESIPLTLSQYTSLRKSKTQFFLRTGHQDPTIERVVKDMDYFLIVKKIGAGKKVAQKSQI